MKKLSVNEIEKVVDQILQLFAGEQPSSLLDPAAWPGRAKS